MSAAFTFTAVSTVAQAREPLPVENWSIRHSVSDVSVSPDGKHILVMKLESKRGENILEIYKTDDFSKPLRRLNAAPMEMVNARWVSDNIIVGTAWKVVKTKIKRPEEDVKKYKTYIYNLEENSFSEAPGNFQIVSVLPKEPDYILIGSGNAISNNQGVDPYTAFRPRSYYKLSLKNGTKSLVIKGNEKYPNAAFDVDGNPRFNQSLERGTHELVTFYRKPGDTSWSELEQRYDFDEHENLYRRLSRFYGFAGLKQDDPNTGYVIDALNGADKAALYEFDFNTGKYGKKLFEAPDADVTDVMRHSMFWAGNNKLVAAIYPGAKMERHWFDMEEKALYEQLESKIPNAYQVSISSRSRDGKTMIVQNHGPKDAGSFWLVKDGKMANLASRKLTIQAKDLSDVEYVRYTARDGLTIPAYITKPEGTGPFPTIIMPHGGPHINEVVTYDGLSQFLANNGYLVLQPQYRMSTGWGKKHFDAAYGQHGLAMQDDKDDGAQYLVKRGLADPDRMAMFGWSYGGYAALVAASREPNLYQCVIAGAAVADAKKVYLGRRGGGRIKALDDWSQRRGGYVGINPIDEVDKVNVPILMIHGSIDPRVMFFNFKDYKKAINKAGKGNLFHSIVLKGGDHGFFTYTYDLRYQLHSGVLDFLKNDCGPGGL